MATENPEVSSQPENEELPTPQFSGSGDSPTSTDAEALVSRLVESLTPKIEEAIERKVKSAQDKRLSKVDEAERIRKALRGRADLLAELESSGVEISKELRNEMRIRDLEEQLAQQVVQPTQVRDDGSSGQKAAVTEAIAELSKYGLDSNDAGFIELLRGKYANRAEFDLKVQRFVVGKLAPPKPANPADIVQSPVTAGATGKNPDALKSEYIKEMQANRGNKAAIKALQEKYKRQGFDPGSVGFNV